MINIKSILTKIKNIFIIKVKKDMEVSCMKKFCKTAKFLDKFFLLFAGLIVLGAITCCVLTIINSYVSAFSDYLLFETIIQVFYYLIGMLVSVYEIIIIRKILAPMKMGKPFDIKTSKNIRKLAWIFLVGGLILFIPCTVARIMMVMNDNNYFNTLNLISNFNFGFILCSLFLFFLSYIFKYGEALQKLSDETL